LTLDEELPGFDLYEELEVSPSASSETIEAAWRSLVRRNHPDRAAGSAEAETKTKRLNQAHYWLSDPARRRQYDESAPKRRRRKASPATTEPAPEPKPEAPRRKRGRAKSSSDGPPEPPPHAPPIDTNWTLPRLLYRCDELNPDELRALVAAAKSRPVQWWGEAHDAITRAKAQFIAASASRSEANQRRSLFMEVGPRLAWPAYSNVKRMADAGPAWQISDQAASAAHEAAIALFWKDWLSPTEFAGYFLPWHTAIGLDSNPSGPVARPPTQRRRQSNPSQGASGRDRPTAFERIVTSLWKESIQTLGGSKKRRR
jgi:hypothetical protein